MERIILITDTKQTDINTIRFACFVARITRSKFTGILLNTVENEFSELDAHRDAAARESQRSADVLAIPAQETMRYLLNECKINGVSGNVHISIGNPLEDALYESRFADLIITSSRLSFEAEKSRDPSSFVKQLLAKSECPIMLAPDQFDSIEEIVFCYDGSASSLFAMKQFTYLFPELKNKKTTVLEIIDPDFHIGNPGFTRLLNWMEGNFGNPNYEFIEGRLKSELFSYFLKKKNVCVVMGSYGRSFLSNLCKPSASDLLIKTIDLPIFIAHN